MLEPLDARDLATVYGGGAAPGEDHLKGAVHSGLVGRSDVDGALKKLECIDNARDSFRVGVRKQRSWDHLAMLHSPAIKEGVRDQLLGTSGEYFDNVRACIGP